MAGAKYQQIKQVILDNIATGQWPEGHGVPSENQLAEQHRVSRMTARRALQELAEQGVLIRTQGAQTLVASLKSQSSIVEIRNIADEIRAGQHAYRADVLQLCERPADEFIAAQLGLTQGDTVFYSAICHHRDELPVQLEQRFVNPHLVPDYLAQDFSQLTPHEYLCQVAPLTRARHQIEAILTDKLVQQCLQIDALQPCLHIQRHTFSKDGMVSYVRLTSPGNRYTLGGQLEFSGRQQEENL